MEGKGIKERVVSLKDSIKEGCVNFVTNPKIIQAFLTGSAFAIIELGVFAITDGIKGYVTMIPHIYVTDVQISFIIMMGVAAFWYWADNNQERFEMMVEDATDVEEGEQEAITEFSENSVGNSD